MKPLRLVVYLFLITAPLNLLAQIKVVDSLTKLPIIGVTISIANSNTVQITDEFGVIDLKKLNLTDDKSIILTSIGYEKKVVSSNYLAQNEVIFLNQVTYTLNEVRISAKNYRNHLVGGGMSLLHGSNSYGSYAYEEARFFANEYKEKSKILAVQYFVIKKQSFQKKTNVDLSNAFGVRIYEANVDGSPGKPLLVDPLVVTAKDHGKWFNVNLEQYDIEVPKYGFIIGYEIFSASFYGAKSNRVSAENFIAPVLAIKTFIRKSSDSWRRYRFTNSKWTRDPHSHFAIRAMVAEPKI